MGLKNAGVTTQKDGRKAENKDALPKVPKKIRGSGASAAPSEVQGVDVDWDAAIARFDEVSAFRLNDIERVRTTGWKRRK
jgi:hypothetical protein